MHTDLQALLDRLTLEASGVPIYVQIRDQMLRAIGEAFLDRQVALDDVAAFLDGELRA